MDIRMASVITPLIPSSLVLRAATSFLFPNAQDSPFAASESIFWTSSPKSSHISPSWRSWGSRARSSPSSRSQHRLRNVPADGCDLVLKELQVVNFSPAIFALRNALGQEFGPEVGELDDERHNSKRAHRVHRRTAGSGPGPGA